MEKENKNKSVVLKNEENVGVIQVADDVVASIACIAAVEVEGVNSIAGSANGSEKDKSYSKLPRGVKVEVLGSNVVISIALILEYGFSIPVVCRNVQDKVKATVENMTGLTCSDVNLRIINIKVK